MFAKLPHVTQMVDAALSQRTLKNVVFSYAHMTADD